MRVDAPRKRLLVVRETHEVDRGEPENALVAIGFDGVVSVLAQGADFYAAPRLSPDGQWLAWLSWDHPDMPWDSCRLWLAKIEDNGALASPVAVTGGDGVAAFQPEWSPDGVLHFVSDHTGWWNLYCWADGAAKALCPMAAEFGLPQWVFGMTTYGFAADGTLIATYCQDGHWRLGRIEDGGGPRNQNAILRLRLAQNHQEPSHLYRRSSGPAARPGCPGPGLRGNRCSAPVGGNRH
jgi:hypothetical protein